MEVGCLTPVKMKSSKKFKTIIKNSKHNGARQRAVLALAKELSETNFIKKQTLRGGWTAGGVLVFIHSGCD